ncbi:unnamed protein product, partial [Durusdinium trenchii]
MCHINQNASTTQQIVLTAMRTKFSAIPKPWVRLHEGRRAEPPKARIRCSPSTSGGLHDVAQPASLPLAITCLAWPTTSCCGCSSLDPSRASPTMYSEMEVSFSTADWILSLGVGVEIPRMGEKAFVENLAYNAEQGVIISWGRQGQNPRSEAEVRQIFSLHGFILDELVTSYLRLFSGLAHAPERDDLLVLRKATRSASERGLVALELIDEWGFDRCAAAGVEMQHGLQGKASQYGPLGHGRMWVSGNCVGRFRAGRSGEMVLCISHSKRFRECDLPGLEPGFEQLSG